MSSDFESFASFEIGFENDDFDEEFILSFHLITCLELNHLVESTCEHHSSIAFEE